MAGEEREVEITVRRIGPGRPARMRVPSPVPVGSALRSNPLRPPDPRLSRVFLSSPVLIGSWWQVCELRRAVAADGCLPVEQLKLILRGQTLLDRGVGGDDLTVSLKDGDSLIVAVIPKPPAKHLREDFDDDDDELKFQIPESTSWWKKRLFSFLHEKLRLPDILLMTIFSITLKAWVGIILWFVLAPVAHRWDMGPIYILGTGFVVILINLGKRQDGDVSAYSIFNEDFRELPGTLNADRLDRDIRTGQF